MRNAAALFLCLLLAAALLFSGDLLVAALDRNLGHLLLLGRPGPCGDGFSSPAVGHLEQAARLQAAGPSAWRTLLRVKGWSDRQWIRTALGPSPQEWVDRGALLQAAETLRPSSWAMEQSWTEERCRAAWDAWTVGLVWALDGRWAQSVAAYQAGIALAPGRVPAEVLSEYYLALARHVLSASDLSAPESLAAAKYLALAGERAEAAERFEALLNSTDLDSEQACQVEGWLRWEGDSSLLPGPGVCGSHGSDATWAPGWDLSAESTTAREAPASGGGAARGRLWSLDLDAEVLEAGAEVLGTLYWRTSDGEMSLQHFRQPNLWPNSGASWLPLEGFTTCLPGYMEPGWVLTCAGSQADSHDVSNAAGAGSPVGRVHVPADEGPDTFISTASVLVPMGRAMIYGGRWRLRGDLPGARMARYGGDSQDPRAYYEVLLELGTLPRSGEFTSQARLIPELPWSQEFVGWMHPRHQVGKGDLEFDDVFAFVLPAAGTASPEEGEPD